MNHLIIAVLGKGASYTVGTSLSHQVCKSESRVRVSARCAIFRPKEGQRKSTHTHRSFWLTKCLR